MIDSQAHDRADSRYHALVRPLLRLNLDMRRSCSYSYYLDACALRQGVFIHTRLQMLRNVNNVLDSESQAIRCGPHTPPRAIQAGSPD